MLLQAMAQRIEHWSLDKLAPYPKNPRRHSDAQIAAIAGSISAFGFNSPLLIDSGGMLIAGHGRYLASRARKSRSSPRCYRTGMRRRPPRQPEFRFRRSSDGCSYRNSKLPIYRPAGRW